MAATLVGRQRCKKCRSRLVRCVREDEAIEPPRRVLTSPASIVVAGEPVASWRGEAEWGRAVADWSRGGLKGKREEAAGRRSSIF